MKFCFVFLAEIYSGLVGTASILSVTRSVVFYYICVNAARILHNRMFGAVLRAPIRFFDTSPIGKTQPFSVNRTTPGGWSIRTLGQADYIVIVSDVSIFMNRFKS